MSARPITIVALVQALLVIICFLALGATLKIQGYPSESSVRWNSLTVLLRQYGLWTLLLPLLFVVFCLFAERKWPATFSDRDIIAVGLSVALIIFVAFFDATIDSHTRPTFLKTSPSPPPAKIARRLQIPEN